MLPADCRLQVREENEGQSPLEDEFPDEQLGSSCRSVLPRLHQTGDLAPDQKLTGAAVRGNPILSPKWSCSNSGRPMGPGLTVLLLPSPSSLFGSGDPVNPAGCHFGSHRDPTKLPCRRAQTFPENKCFRNGIGTRVLLRGGGPWCRLPILGGLVGDPAV